MSAIVVAVCIERITDDTDGGLRLEKQLGTRIDRKSPVI